MRLWSIHPRYLDRQGLLALWRESLLARKVLQGKTKGYRNHPQLIRFRNSQEPMAAIDTYLSAVLDESCLRGYCFDASKIGNARTHEKIPVTTGQMAYELSHLRKKLMKRCPEMLKGLPSTPDPHPLFRPTEGDTEPWELL